MRRLFLSAISLFCFCFSGFAAKPYVYPVKMSYNTLSTDSRGVKTQTVISDDGYEISVGVLLEDTKLKYFVSMENLASKDFLLKKDCIQVFEGNYDNDSWTLLNINPTSLVITSGGQTIPEAPSASTDELSAEDACLIVGGTILCGLFLIDLCDSDSDTDYKIIDTKHSRFVDKPQRIFHNDNSYPWLSIWLFNDYSSTYDSSLISQNQGMVLNSTNVGADYYSVEFSVDAGTGPDYKLRVTLSDKEFIDYYFMRSDRNNIINPWEDRTYGRHSVLFSMDVPYINSLGGYYIYSGKPVGWYYGAQFGIKTVGRNIYGTAFKHDFDNVIMESNAPYPLNYNSDLYYKYKFKKSSEFDSWFFNMSTGLTVKTFPHTWLMLGCGIDLLEYNWYGTFYSKSSTDSVNWSSWSELCNGWLNDDMLYPFCTPLVGVNLIFNHLDIAAAFEYVIQRGPRFNAMLGFAF